MTWIHPPVGTYSISQDVSEPARWEWTAEITTEPSPTAEATRLTDPARASPTANSPGTDVPNRVDSTLSSGSKPLVAADREPVGAQPVSAPAAVAMPARMWFSIRQRYATGR
jgi:hypothetical protein